MAKEIFMPKLSSTMEVGTILQWLKEEGDAIEVGDPLFEIMTDKINIEVESYEEGILLKKYYEVDDEVPINMVIGYIGKENEQVPDTPPVNEENLTENTEQGTEVSNSILEKELPTEQEGLGKIRATPAARRVSRARQFPLENVAGSGPKEEFTYKM
jgi:pyruvate dehydrogenase E2 component (dihydrolipoamide acetyltransferase)